MVLLYYLLSGWVTKFPSPLWFIGRTQDPDSISAYTLKRLKLISGSCYLPKNNEGEDAHFIEEEAFGVADGVGGWARMGIDSGQYASQLMNNTVIEIQRDRSVDPAQILRKACLNTKAKGSSTACIVALRDQFLQAANVGDSGFMVIRKGIAIYRSPVQQHYFNCPYQLGNSYGCDHPRSAVLLKCPIKPGDVIVAGTDGLFDNLFEQEIAEDVIYGTKDMGICPQRVAMKIAEHAKTRSRQKDIETPFSNAANRAGYKLNGGKVDDITVVVAYVISSNFKHEHIVTIG